LYQSKEIIIKDIKFKVELDNLKRHIVNAESKKEQIIANFYKKNKDVAYVLENASHLVVQVEKAIFIDMANIDGLNQ
jgi:hypothetical protein